MRALDKFGSAFLRLLFRRMKELGLNQSALARRMKCSRAYVSKVLSGDVSFTFATAIRFCRALELDFIPSAAPVSQPAPTTNPPSSAFSKIRLAVAAIESGARQLGISGREMHDRLKAQNLIHNRLLARYDILHTQSQEWVTDDIVETLKNCEAAALPPEEDADAR